MLSLTIVSPGPIKSSPRIDAVFARAMSAVSARLTASGWKVVDSRLVTGVTGPEFIAAVAADAQQVKAAMIELEEADPWGRLWDVDVLDEAGRPINRTTMGAGPRRCLICDRPSPQCARSRRHSVAELQFAVAALVGDE